jgi:hypothetical protein
VSECACIPRDRDGESKIMTQVNCYRVYIYIYIHTQIVFSTHFLYDVSDEWGVMKTFLPKEEVDYKI